MNRRRWPSIGLSILCAAVTVQAVPAVLAKDGTTADQKPALNLPSLTRQARLYLSADRIETYQLSLPEHLLRLSQRIDVLVNEKWHEKAQGRAMEEAQRLIKKALVLQEQGQSQSAEMSTTLTHLNIMINAFSYNYISPVPVQVGISGIPSYFWENVATGTIPAGNPKPEDLPFWADPGDIASKDLFKPVRGNAIVLKGTVCTYASKKTSYGIKGGFEIDCGKKRDFKLKFGSESRTEPFNSRIYNALGFNVPTVVHTTGVELHYDRRIFLEFQSRGVLRTVFSVFGRPINGLGATIGGYLNPFQFIKEAKLKDGRTICAKELYRGLFGIDPPWKEGAIDRPSDKPDMDAARYNEAYEKQVETVTTVAGSLEVKEKNMDNLGSWDWNNPSYSELCEVRGAAVLSMWLGNYDVRWDNNRVRLVEDEMGNVRLKMFISDIGAGLGDALNILLAENDAPDAFSWRFTVGRSERNFHSTGGMNSVDVRVGDHGIAVVDYLPVIENKVFRNLTRDDALWMARMIAQLSENQIKQALIAAGFESAEVFLLTQKLLNRREHLLQDAGGGGITLRRSETFHSHDPVRDGQMTAVLPDGRVVVARAEKVVLRNLRLVEDRRGTHLPGEYSE